jgi:DNA recombination protein RmuC
MEIVFILLGLAIGAVLGYLIAKSKVQSDFSKDKDELLRAKTEAEARIATSQILIDEKEKIVQQWEGKYHEKATAVNNLTAQLATANQQISGLEEKLENQKKEIEEMNKTFTTQFENIANKILESKSEKFTNLNKQYLKDLLDPLKQNIETFRTKVDEESKQRFSLGEKVKELTELNKKISDEANNLTKALKGEAKTQGRWGEMILESILEKSGLEKDREYFMEHELKDEAGKALRSEETGKKMRPDAVIKYPDKRSVIIDSKVSLNAFTRFLESTDPEEQEKELKNHVQAVKNHIIALNARGYDDYNKALDFVMMFIPSEPAYMAAIKGDPDLWNFAYDKRILLINPTNLVTSLKLIVDLWKREHQNKNAMDIAERGSLIYEKLLNFIGNFQQVGSSLASAKNTFDEAMGQLSTGRGNLVSQALKLKELGIKSKKELPADLTKLADETEE